MTDGSILVLGAGGFIGAALLHRLAARGERIVALARQPSSSRPQLPGVTWVHGDLRRPEVRERLFACRPRAVIHGAAAHLPPEAARDPTGDIACNLIPLVACLECAATHGVRRHVFLSSGGTVYGPLTAPATEDNPTNPTGAYGAGKLAGEKYVQALSGNAGATFAILRLSNVYGPGQMPRPGFGFIPTAVLKALAGEEIVLFNGGQDRRDYVFVDDVCGAIVAALDAESSFVGNVGSGVALSGLEVIEHLRQALDIPLTVRATAGRPGDVTFNALDTSRLARLLGWRAETDFANGLGRTIDWLRRRH